MIKSMDELVEKMHGLEEARNRDGKESDGLYRIFEGVYGLLLASSGFEYFYKFYNFVSGFLYGLHAAHFISDMEFQILYSELDCIYCESAEKKDRE